MITLHSLKHKNKSKKRVGRGPSSGCGKTSSRGFNGAGSRSGYKRRYGKEGGQFPVYLKVPTRGFTRGKFLIKTASFNLSLIDNLFNDGEVVSLETLVAKKILPKDFRGKVKILSDGDITKKITIEADNFSKKTIEKLEKQKIVFKILGNKWLKA